MKNYLFRVDADEKIRHGHYTRIISLANALETESKKNLDTKSDNLLINEAYETLINSNFECFFPVAAFSFPIQRALSVLNNKIEIIAPENNFVQSQDIDDISDWKIAEPKYTEHLKILN
jgi:hypothetical protein